MSKIKIFSLGGLNENGKNMYIVNVDDSIFVFDAGLKYPSDKMLGVDYIIPKIDYLRENIDKVKGVFISHCHDSNMGAIPDLLEDFPSLPVYATKFSMEVLKKELEDNKIKATNLKEVRPHSKIDFDKLTLFPIAVTHSVPETVSYVLYTEDGAIVYATDFVFDSTMMGVYKTDIGKLAYVGKQGVLCLLAESMYAGKEGHTSPKHRIHETVNDLLNRHENRIIVSVFALNIFRIGEILQEIAKTNRKVVIMGKKLIEVVNYAIDNKYITFSKDQIGDLSNVNDPDVIIMTSDDKEKNYANLEKIINGYDKYIKIKDTDTIFISEPVYAGDEKKFAKMLDEVSRINIEVVSLSKKNNLLCHASSEDLMLLINLMNPKYYVPIRGEYRFQYMNASLSEEIGIAKENILLKLNGDVITFENGVLKEDNEHINADEILIDGKTSDDIGEIVLKDREMLSNNGIVIVSATIDRKSKKLLAGPEILTRGFIYVKENLDIVEKSKSICLTILNEDIVANEKVDFIKIKNDVREKLGNYFIEETGSRPMIISVIQEA